MKKSDSIHYMQILARYEPKLQAYNFNHSCMIPECHSSMFIVRKKKIKDGAKCFLICNNCRTALYAVLRRIERYGISLSDTIIQE